MKFFKVSFLVCFLSAFLFGDTYIIEADSELAKELKEIVEKHSKDENASVGIYKKNESSEFEKKGYHKVGGMSAAGKALFLQKCAKCHGETGEKRAYGVSQRLKDMTGEEMAINLRAYTNDGEYGGRFKIIMQAEALKVSDNEMKLIIAYIKGEDDPYLNRSFGGDFWEKQNKPIQTTPTEQGSYLK